MKKIFGLFFLLSACAGGVGGGGVGGLAPSGGVGDVSSSGGELGAEAPPVTVAGTAGASGSEGVLGSQSSSSDIEVHFYRDYALDFEDEVDVQDVVVERPMVLPGQAYDYGIVRKIGGGVVPGKSLQNPLDPPSENASTNLNQPLLFQTWVRVVDCGNFPDSEIEPLIPAADKEKPWAADKLLWFILHLPRAGYSGTVECHQPTYRDFPVESFNTVDLSALEGSPQDLFFFHRVNAADFGSAGELSLNASKALSDEQWLALAKKSKLRIVRLLPNGSTIRYHPMNPTYLSPN